MKKGKELCSILEMLGRCSRQLKNGIKNKGVIDMPKFNLINSLVTSLQYEVDNAMSINSLGDSLEEIDKIGR